MQPLDFPLFANTIAKGLGLESTDLVQSTSCRVDLALDSLQMIEITFILEDLGIAVDEDWIWSCETLGQIHSYYVSRINHPMTP